MPRRPRRSTGGGGAILAGQGDGSALWPYSGCTCSITQGDLTDFNGDNPLQVVNAYASVYSTGLPDLLATSGDSTNGYYLDYYYSTAPCGFIQAFAINTPTPDGTADWNRWTLATLSEGSAAQEGPLPSAIGPPHVRRATGRRCPEVSRESSHAPGHAPRPVRQPRSSSSACSPPTCRPSGAGPPWSGCGRGSICEHRCTGRYAAALSTGVAARSQRPRAAASCRAGHDARSPARVIDVRPLPEGPPKCELNSGGTTARFWMARDARAGAG